MVVPQRRQKIVSLAVEQRRCCRTRSRRSILSRKCCWGCWLKGRTNQQWERWDESIVFLQIWSRSGVAKLTRPRCSSHPPHNCSHCKASPSHPGKINPLAIHNPAHLSRGLLLGLIISYQSMSLPLFFFFNFHPQAKKTKEDFSVHNHHWKKTENEEWTSSLSSSPP